MARTTRQTVIFGVEDWKQIYQTYREADFQSYDFETLRKSFVDYLRLYYPETFNDYTESSEFIALLDVIAFMGQALAFRTDLNTRENYLDTAERRDSVVRLANLVSYTAKRNLAAQGLLKVFSVSTTQNVVDYNGVNLSNVIINWADPTNLNWLEQWNTVMNAAMVDTQRVGRPGPRATILGVDTALYSLNLVSGFLPVVNYTATVDGISMPFEAVTSDIVDGEIVEPSPRPNTTFNVLFRNDRLGFQSNNNGWFVQFKQGSLLNQDFNLAERVSNRTVNVNIEGINNTDRWLFQLDDVGTVAREWEFTDNVYASAAEQALRPVFSTTSRSNDQITLVFGDGVFSEIPVGFFRVYVRSSNGLQYIINPVEMQNVVIPISYIDRNGNLQTLTLTCGITQPVTNSQARESIDAIKQRAPARYYTQNRMVNGEDYNLFPFTLYSSIIKSKAVNRSSIGTSRYLELVDNTGKYSSTNSFGNDGAIWQNNILPTYLFTWTNRNEIADVITNQVIPSLNRDTFIQFYYANFPREIVDTGVTAGSTWQQSTTMVNETTGFFRNSLGQPIPVGPVYSTTVFEFVTVRSLVKFTAPTINGQPYYFDKNNRLQPGLPTRAGDRLNIWAGVLQVVGDGYNNGLGNLTNGEGPVVLNNFVPTGAVVDTVIPVFVGDLSQTLQAQIVEQILFFKNFGLGYDNNGTVPGSSGPGSWYLITSGNLDSDADWSQTYAGNTSNTNLDASWMVQFLVQDQNYTITNRGLAYFFGSVLSTRFFFYGNQKIYDSRTGTTIRDYVNVLSVNTQPDSTSALPGDIYATIIDQPIEPDGFVDDFQVLVSYRDRDDDGIPDDPDFFDEIVAPTVNANLKLVFFQLTVDFDNLQRYLLAAPGVVNSTYATLDDLELVKFQFSVDQMFYAYAQQQFYKLTESVSGVKSLVLQQDWIARTGRGDLIFQYRHNAPLTSRIDPTTTNIIDIYVATLSYYTQYQNWLKDTTGSVVQPDPPSIDQLTLEYNQLNDYKMLSDNIVLNSVSFKPLFGPKAAPNLRALIKVIKASNSVVSTSQIQSAVLAAMNDYFSIDKWNFGDTFYFSELAAFLHRTLGSFVSSVVLVPTDPGKYFGDMYEVRSQPNEIFVNGATIDNIVIIDALTSTNLKTAPGSGVI